jgi:hypothetical protein
MDALKKTVIMLMTEARKQVVDIVKAKETDCWDPEFESK